MLNRLFNNYKIYDLFNSGGHMVHIDLCTKEGVMKAYAFQTPMQAVSLLDKIKND